MADEHELTWRLSDPGMDLLERAGLAGLYMALRAAAETETNLSPLTWREEDLKKDSVTVRWSGPAKPAFVRLMEWAWQVRGGVLYLPAVHDIRDAARLQNRVAMHNGIMRTFLQHTNAQPKLEKVIQVIELGEQQTVTISFEPPATRVEDPERGINPKTKRPYKKKVGTSSLRPHEDLMSLFGRGQLKRKDISLSSWVYPGIGGRYGEEKKGKAWKGSPKAAILLMLAPTVCFYLRLPKSEVKIKTKKVMVDNWVAVIPDVRHLQHFADARPRLALSPDGTDVASLGDGGMHFLARYSSAQPRRRLYAGCRVVAMGKVSYYPNQSVRKSVLDVSAEERALKRYRILHRELQNTYVPYSHDTPELPSVGPDIGGGARIEQSAENVAQTKALGRIRVPAARGRIADNIVHEHDWYADLTVPTEWDQARLERIRKRNKELNDRDDRNRPTSPETILFDSLRSQGRQLMNLISEDEMWSDPRDRIFLEAFWETLSRCYYLEKKAAENRGGARSVHDRLKDFNAKLHRELLQSSTHLLIRKTLSEFFALPSTLPRSETLRNNVPVVWRIIDADWRKGRDLALLALMTYRARKGHLLHGKTESSTAKGE